MGRAQRLIIALSMAGLTCGCAGSMPTSVATPSPPETTTRVLAPTPTPVPPLSFDILGVNFYEDPVGSLRFLAELRNTNDFDVEGLEVEVSLLGPAGQTVASQAGYARLDVLRAGDTAPVIVVFLLESPDFSAYEVQIRAQKADYLAELLHRDLQVVDDAGRVGEWVPYEVLGEVQNPGGRDARSVTLVVTCYDVDGKVVGVATGRPAESTIPAGGSSEFLISVDAVAGEIASYKVQVEGLLANR